MKSALIAITFLVAGGCTNSSSGVLGRTVRLDSLCDDFEDTNWHYNYEGGLWRGGNASGRGEPEMITRVATPTGGKSGSTGALEIRTNQNDPDGQADFTTAEFTQKLGRELTRADQPVFIVRVWLPPFEQWNKGLFGNFGFRQTARLNDNSDYYQSIWLVHDGNKPFFFFPNGTVTDFDEIAGRA